MKKRKNHIDNDYTKLKIIINNDFLEKLYPLLKFSRFIGSGDPEDLVISLVAIKQGVYCHDCEKSFFECDCEYCEDCKFNKCLCLLDIEKKSEYTTEERIKVSKIYWELSKLFGELVTNSSFAEDEKDKNFIKFVKSLNSDSSFPEYQKITLDLLETFK